MDYNELEFETTKRISPELNLAPLIDIVFLLLVFFMLTSSMIKTKTIELQLPDSSSAKVLKTENINLSVNAAGIYFLDGKELGLDAIKNTLDSAIAEDSDQAIILSVDKAATSQTLVTALDFIRNSGGSNISVATK